MILRKFSLVFLALIWVSIAWGQQPTATIQGKVTNQKGEPTENVSIGVLNTSIGTTTNINGRFALEVPAQKQIIIVFSDIRYRRRMDTLILSPGETYKLSVQITEVVRDIDAVEISDRASRHANLTRIDPKTIEKLPSAGGNFEAILFSNAGVSSNNELSSGYNVRGGNFDENLIYVNDIEIYRPFLVRSGRQEGLSFINSNMVSSILFSAGGFEARYGDKMSSVLDIKYREPEDFEGVVQGSLLGGSITLGDASDNHRFTQLHGLRYRTNQYVLNSLETDGDYKPTFLDYQGYFTYDVTDKFKLSALFNVTRNRYVFIPEDRETRFGTINEALQFQVFFEGQERNQYDTYTGAIAGDWLLNHDKTKLKFIFSGYRSLEDETYDIEGAYRIDELERDLGSEEFGEVAFNRGVGGFIQHARNYFDATVLTAQHKGYHNGDVFDHYWGARYNYEQITDQFKEWEVTDSAGYLVPQNPGITGWYVDPNDSLNRLPISPRNEIPINDYVNANNQISSHRTMGYYQLSKSIMLDSAELGFTAGGRFNYWTYNNQLVFSPRVNAYFVPNWERQISFRAAWGYYRQPAFYRELRDFDGVLNPAIRAQTSIHYVVGADYEFSLWKRPFLFSVEAYYKSLKDLIPYEIENVRIRYYADNISVGWVQGLDLKLNGEFIKDAESWFSISFMQAREDIIGDSYTQYYNASGDTIVRGFTADQVAVDSATFYPGSIPRQTDQLVNFGMFFQDYLPRLPYVKVNLNFLYGTRLPFGPPSRDRYQDTLRMPSYRRVDIGFSYDIISPVKERKKDAKMQWIKKMWVSVEVFNMLQVNNTISFTWVRDINYRLYGIPNHLTSRQVNLKLTAQF